MGKKKRPRKKAKNKRRSDTATPKMGKINAPASRSSRGRRIFSLVIKAIAICAAVVTIWVAFAPRVCVYSRAALDPNNPVFTYFAVRNEGYLAAMRDVTIWSSIKELRMSDGTRVIGLGDFTNKFSDPKHVARVIAPGEEYSILLPLSGLIHHKIDDLDIAVVVLFRPIRWWPWKCEKKYRFVTTPGKDGRRYWVQKPIDQ